jgi:hypothetical protein
MYLRWQSRKLQRPKFGYYGGEVRDSNGEYVYNGRGNLLRTRKATGTQDVRWATILVENKRVNGKPRQRHVAFLASVTDSQIEVIHQRRYFWDNVLDTLDRLDNRLSRDDRKRIEAAIALKVPRLTREEHEASVDHCRKTMSRNFGIDLGDQPPYREPVE